MNPKIYIYNYHTIKKTESTPALSDRGCIIQRINYKSTGKVQKR